MRLDLLYYPWIWRILLYLAILVSSLSSQYLVTAMPPRELLQWWHLFEMQFWALLRAIFVPAMTLESNFFEFVGRHMAYSRKPVFSISPNSFATHQLSPLTILYDNKPKIQYTRKSRFTGDNVTTTSFNKLSCHKVCVLLERFLSVIAFPHNPYYSSFTMNNHFLQQVSWKSHMKVNK